MNKEQIEATINAAQTQDKRARRIRNSDAEELGPLTYSMVRTMGFEQRKLARKELKND
jgi:hypothetical protein